MGFDLADARNLEQLSFEGWEPGKVRRFNAQYASKLLITVRPPAALAARIFADSSHHAAKQTKREAHPATVLHITLLCVGCFEAVPEGLVHRLKNTLGEIKARPVPITFDRTSLFGNRGSLALHSSHEMLELQSLSTMLQRALWRANLPFVAPSSFAPHLALITGCGRIEPMPVEKPYSWLAGSFELVCSHVGEPQLELLARFALTPKAECYERPESQLHLPGKIIGHSKRSMQRASAQ